MIKKEIEKTLKGILSLGKILAGILLGVLAGMALRELGLSLIKSMLLWGGALAITLIVIGILAHREAKANA